MPGWHASGAYRVPSILVAGKLKIHLSNQIGGVSLTSKSQRDSSIPEVGRPSKYASQNVCVGEMYTFTCAGFAVVKIWLRSRTIESIT